MSDGKRFSQMVCIFAHVLSVFVEDAGVNSAPVSLVARLDGPMERLCFLSPFCLEFESQYEILTSPVSICYKLIAQIKKGNVRCGRKRQGRLRYANVRYIRIMQGKICKGNLS